MTAPAPETNGNDRPIQLITWCDKKGVRVISFVEKELGINFDADRLEEELAHAIQGLASPKVVLNMSDVAYVSSRPLGSLVGFHKRVWSAGGQIKMSNTPDYVHETIRVAKLHRIFELYETEQEALNSLA